MDSSFAALQRAIDYTNASTGRGGRQRLPDPPSVDPDAVGAQRGRIHQADPIVPCPVPGARLRALPLSAMAANWDLIIADAQAGITADHFNVTSTTNGPGGGWRRIYDGGTTWHQMPPFIIGMGDVSGNYLTWLNQSLVDRGNGNVGVLHGDAGFALPTGQTRVRRSRRTSTSSDCEVAGGQANFSCARYFTNRKSGSDQYSGNGWGWSNYDFNRFHWWATKGDAGSQYNGTLVFYPKAALDMLQAEGLIHKGQFSAAATLINASRTKNGLPALTAFDNTSPVPGGANCVPKKPSAMAQARQSLVATCWKP